MDVNVKKELDWHYEWLWVSGKQINTLCPKKFYYIFSLNYNIVYYQVLFIRLFNPCNPGVGFQPGAYSFNNQEQISSFLIPLCHHCYGPKVNNKLSF